MKGENALEAQKNDSRELNWSILEKDQENDEFRARLLAVDLSDGDGLGCLEESISRFEREGVAEKPGTVRRLGRVALDAMGIRSERVEEQRRREAMPEALKIYRQRKAESIKVFEDAMQEAYDERSGFNAMVKDIDESLEQYANVIAESEKNKNDKKLEHDISVEMWGSKNEKEDRLRQERAQEILEKDLNGRLTKVEDLDLKAEIGGLGVTKSEIDYNGEVIIVYNMEGAPLRMLTTSISYKDTASEANEGSVIGAGMMHRLEVQPLFWLDNEQKVKEENKILPYNHRRGNTISCSYTDVYKNPDQRLGTTHDRLVSRRDEPYIVYGWDHVGGGSLINAGEGDLRTPQMVGRDWMGSGINENNLNIWDELVDNIPKWGGYNEIVLRRFAENGKAKPPDYLVIENGEISDDIKHHAAVFGVPIINVERKYYSGEEVE